MTLRVQQESLDGVAAEWLRLLDETPEPLPFIHPAWQRVWLDEFQDGRQLLLLSARQGDRLVGIAPFLRQEERLSLVGHYSICDYMDMVVRDEDEDVYASLLETLVADDWRELELRGLREESPTLRLLPEIAEQMGLQVTRELEAVSPRVDLPSTWDEYLGTLTKKDRHELRRKLRRLHSAGRVELRSVTSAEEAPAALDLVLRLMRESRQDKARFMTPAMEQFFRRMVQALAPAGLIRIYVLDLDTVPVAALLCFDIGDSTYMYNSGYDPAFSHLSVGLLSKAMCINDAIERGCRWVDFLRGHESYKYDLGGRDRSIYRCLISRS